MTDQVQTEWRYMMNEKSLAAFIDNDAMIQTLCECIAIKSVSGKPQEGMPFGKGVAEALGFILAKGAGIQGCECRRICGICRILPGKLHR